MKKWQCTVCGYIHEGDEPPEFCPICDARKEEFELIEETIVEPVRSGEQKIVIIGAGAAGIEAARSARRTSDDADIHVYTDEKFGFYSRLFLTSFLAGEKSEQELFVYSNDWFRQNRIELHTGEYVREIIPAEKKILTYNDVINYDSLILATGASPFNPYQEDMNKKGMFVLRKLDEARRILEFAKNAKKALIIGGGILGLETAGALAKHGLQVDVFERFRLLMPRQLDATAAEIMTRILAKKGITVHTEAEILQILGNSRVKGVRLKDGRELDADLVVVAIGVLPNTTLAEDAGLEVNRGVIVDDFLRTSDPSIFAAGDVAEHRGRVYGLWFACVEQGKIAGQNAAGANVTYSGTVPVSVLKVIGTELTSIGQFEAKHRDEQEISQIGEDLTYRKLVIKDNQIIGAIILGNNRLGSAVEALMKKRKPITDEILGKLQNGNWESLISFSREK